MSIKAIFSNKKTLMIVILVLIMVLVSGFVWGQKNIEVIADGNSVAVTTLKSDPKQIIEQAGIQLGPQDEYRLSTEKVKDKTMITVYRAVPVTVTYKGTSNQMMTGKPTVGELLNALEITGEAIRVEPNPETKITANVNIKVVEVSDETIEREEEEQYKTERQPDPTMETGSEELVQSGENGVKAVTVKVHYDDGVKVKEEVIGEKVIKPATSEIIKVGTRDTVDTSRGAMRFRRAIYMEATAYLPTDGNGNGITATGMTARHGVVAVDPSVIPLGTRLYIPGYGVAVAADTGGAINGNIIDLCMETYSEAISFGRRSVKVYILE
ncbi:3D domain-containing protein [Anaerosinus massiliensis]|uniref:3D domain-containing protein n=1 Tax=Massilibacillus massiliensis TaxID=1806837 RepID=UPI000B006CDE|nr:3D domain-containing protein [Massilibacillus massiliensis]